MRWLAQPERPGPAADHGFEPPTPEALQRAFSVQRKVVAACVALYVANGLTLPRDEWFVLVSGVAGLGAVFLYSRTIDPAERAWHPFTDPMMYRLMGVFLLAFLVMVMPVSFTAPLEPPAVVAGLLGLFCFQAIWVIHRYPAVSEPLLSEWNSVPLRVAMATVFGVVFALGLALVAAIVMLPSLVRAIAAGSGATDLAAMWGWLLAAYLLGGLVGGCIAGLLAPVSRWPLGVMLMGLPLTAAFYGSVGLVMPMIEPEFAGQTFHDVAVMAAAAALLAGPMYGIAGRKMAEGF